LRLSERIDSSITATQTQQSILHTTIIVERTYRSMVDKRWHRSDRCGSDDLASASVLALASAALVLDWVLLFVVVVVVVVFLLAK
jgi:hypothetical protein